MPRLPSSPPPRRSGLARLRTSGLLLLLLAGLGASNDAARIEDLGHRLMCACGCKQILLECNHVGCQYSDRMRNELIAAVDHGDNDDLSLQWFVQKYGTTVLAAPTTTGFNRVAWIMPYLALVLGLASVMLVVRTWRRRPPPLPAPGRSAAELDYFRLQARRETEE